MAKERFARTVYDVSGIGGWDAFALTANIAMLAIVYTILGSFMSFIFYYLFDEYDLWHERGLDWEKKSLTYQVADLLIEVALIAVVSFWSTFFVNERFPIIPVNVRFAEYIDTYSTGLFFMYTIFIFVDSFGYKLQYVISRIFGPTFDKWLPDSGSIVDLSLHWSKPGEEKRDTGNSQKMSNKPRKNGEGRTPAST
jgi:hypothetical protein